MEIIPFVGLVLGSSWASGINLYLTVAGLGIAHRLEWFTLPGEMDVIAHPLIIGLALMLYLIEFIADKIPYVDSTWDAVHTFIRPIGGGILIYLAASEGDAVAQMAGALLGSPVALDAHLMKASTRAAVNVSPEPVSNSVASVTEDAAVVGSLWLIIHHPLILVGLVIGFVLLSFWLIPKLFRFIKRIFQMVFKKEETLPTENTSQR